MTKQDMIRSLKKDLQDLKQFALVVLVFVTLFGTGIGVYKSYKYISAAVAEALEPTAEEKLAAEKKAAEQKKFNELLADCEHRSPVGWENYNRYSFCYKQVKEKMKKK